MNAYKIVLTAGFAMFSMFFGSGNLVFPLFMGFQSLSNYPYAILGLIVTAVCVPFLGLLGIIQYQGDRKAYFSILGKGSAFGLSALMLCLMGPFGVIPRCITVAFGGISALFPSLPFWSFSLSFCFLIGALIWQRNKIVSIIGLGLTPFKLGSIVFLIIFGLWYGPEITPAVQSSYQSFWLGIKQGYQTMDLIAAFFFACTIYEYLRNRLREKTNHEPTINQLFRWGLGASLVGALLLGLVYVGFIILGAKYAPFLQTTPPEAMLVEISKQTLGYYAMPVVGFTLAISCLATATVLTTLFVDFVQEDISRNRLSRPQAILFTLVLSFSMSLLGFKSICQILEMVLEWIYPLLVVFAIIQIARKSVVSEKLVQL
jgi:LIVCS family branched-chain amino acid:cation transporter